MFSIKAWWLSPTTKNFLKVHLKVQDSLFQHCQTKSDLNLIGWVHKCFSLVKLVLGSLLVGLQRSHSMIQLSDLVPNSINPNSSRVRLIFMFNVTTADGLLPNSSFVAKLAPKICRLQKLQSQNTWNNYISHTIHVW